MIKILIGGFPCTKFSIAQKSTDRETQPYSGEGWELFSNYLIAKEKFNPDYFIAENNKSIHQNIKDEVSKLLGVNYVGIDSALVSAQGRNRVYWTNINNGNIEQPEDRNIKLQDILESGFAYKEKSHCLTARYNGAVIWNSLERGQRTMVAEVDNNGSEVKNKMVELSHSDKNKNIIIDKYKIDLPDGKYRFRKFYPTECEGLQTLPRNYTAGIPDSERYTCLGNGWTAEVIIHILSYLNIPKDEEIVILSMYDGIATGRYCFEQLGYTNITYYAYEIDKYAMKVAQKNYSDIIQCGDAFDVRKDDWFLTSKDKFKKVI